MWFCGKCGLKIFELEVTPIHLHSKVGLIWNDASKVSKMDENYEKRLKMMT